MKCFITKTNSGNRWGLFYWATITTKHLKLEKCSCVNCLGHVNELVQVRTEKRGLTYADTRSELIQFATKQNITIEEEYK